ncbi:MAG TPA: cytochrome C oxidase subunit IV family protein [Candidatus Binatia bacterium]|jgi:cytochrome c oxidase subunit 4
MISIRGYLAVFIALLALTALTTGVAFINLGGVGNVAVALAIAITKAVLVALYFMHLRYSTRLTVVFAGAGIFWLGILVALTLSDYISRGWVRMFEAVLN